MARISTAVKALFDESIEDHSFYTYEDRLRLVTDLHRRGKFFCAPGADKIGKVPMRSVGYMRNSHGDPDENVSLDRQATKFVTFSGPRLLSLQQLYADPDTSGRTWIDRPGLLTMLRDARAGKFDVVLIEDPDRLARGAYMGLAFEILDGLNIPLVEIPSGRVHTSESIMLHGFLASREVKKIAHRTSDGASRTIQLRGKIVKILAYGHAREYPRGPVIIDPVRGPIVLEANILFDNGLTAGQIIAIFNKKLAAGDTNYKPPGFDSARRRAKWWRRQHLISGGKHEVGLLTNVQGIGLFISGKSETRFDTLSGAHHVSFREREEWNAVDRPDLAIVPKELFERNQKRIAATYKNHVARRAAKAANKTLPPIEAASRYGSSGKRRHLLSSVVCCGVCNAFTYSFHTRLGKKVMLCIGRANSVCKTNFFVDAHQLTMMLVDLVEGEISSAGSLSLFEQSFREEHAGVIGDLLGSRKKLEAQLAGLRVDLEDIRSQSKTAASATAKDFYTEKASGIDKQMAGVEAQLAAIKDPAKIEIVRDNSVAKVRSLLDRLRHPNVTTTDNADDMWIVQTFRRMLSVKIVPNSYDYGAAAMVEIDFSAFFMENTSIMSKRDFTRKFVIRMPPRINRPRRVSADKINTAIFGKPNRYRLSQDEWAALTVLYRNGWNRSTHADRFPRKKAYYDAMFLNLRAGAGPVTIHASRTFGPISLIYRKLRVENLWAATLATLRKFGNEWIDELNPDLIAYLNGKGGRKEDAWTVEVIED
jgi:DNA invertase Pin-like site-specific DNA recombinase